MAEAEKSKPTPVVEPVVKPVKAKTVKIDGEKIAFFNAIALSFATFLGVALIFNAIAGYTNGKWSFGVPFSGIIGSYDISGYGWTLNLALIVLIMSIFGLVTVNKITDAEALKKSWCCISKTFMLFAVLYGTTAITCCFWSLMNIKKGAGDLQKDIWLDGFLPTLVMSGTSFGISMIARAIANGKTALVRVMSYIALSVASVAFVMVFIDKIIDIHATKKSAGSKFLNDLTDLF